MQFSPRRGFTLIEVLIVVVIMATLAGVVLPQFQDSALDARTNTTRYNLRMLREQIQLYSNEHDGRKPATLEALAQQTNLQGAVGTTSAFPYGPYLNAVPENSLTGSVVVRATSTSPPVAASGADDAGWFYHAAGGGVWIDHPEHFSE